MINNYSKLSDFHIIAWFLAFIFCSTIWGLLAGTVAFQYNMPFDFFHIYPIDYNLYSAFVLGMSYCSCAALGLVVLEKLGAYNPVIAFVILMAGVILFVDMLFGRTSLVNSQHQVWLLLVPVVIIRDIVTFFYLRDLYRNSDEIHEIDISCKTIEEPDFNENDETHTKANDLDVEELANKISADVAEYGREHRHYLRA